MDMMHILTECSTNKTYKRSSIDKEQRSIPAGVISDLCDSGVTSLAIGAVVHALQLYLVSCMLSVLDLGLWKSGG